MDHLMKVHKKEIAKLKEVLRNWRNGTHAGKQKPLCNKSRLEVEIINK